VRSMTNEDGDEVNDAVFWWFKNHQSRANIVCTKDGTLVFRGHNHEIQIEKIGTVKERVVIKNIADLVIS
jgi:hypothetical protein